MDIVESTDLWKTCFEVQGNANQLEKDFRDKLAIAFKTFRSNARSLAEAIPIDLPDFTVHGMEHIDSLWKYADLLIPTNDYLNPTEAFILGSAFLIHDLGLAFASHQDGLASLHSYPEWRNLLARELWRRNGTIPSDQDMADADAVAIESTKAHILRLKHAEKALDLVVDAFSSQGSNQPYFLLEDQSLRGQYGRLIGEIAYSHWWSVEKVVKELAQQIGAHPDGPTDWTIDRLKIALLLRTCDACHLDGKRAPGLLRALRKPIGVGRLHWRFSECIQFPHIEHSELCFTSTTPFSGEDREAWWVGFDLLSLANQELTSVDSVLEKFDKRRLRANKVAGIQSTIQLSRLVRTSGWKPVDTRIKASNVASLVTKLGGKGLYGERPWVPVRELIQNAHDAVLARRVEASLDENWGEIAVRLSEPDKGKFLLEVSDTGIGMSEEVVTGPLLDFGQSYWDSALAMQEHPELSLDRFRPTGKFGIGFFSVFMVSDRVQILTRTNDDSKSGTRVLQFDSGVDSPPVLREAKTHEQLETTGTKVKLWLKHNPGDKDWFLNAGDASPIKPSSPDAVRKTPWKLNELCQWVCPASEVTIISEQLGHRETAVVAKDWININGVELLRRTLLERSDLEVLMGNRTMAQVAQCIRPLKDLDGDVIARAALVPQGFETAGNGRKMLMAIHLAGAFRSFPEPCLLGVYRGGRVGLTRSEGYASKFASEPELVSEWATEQANLASKAGWSSFDMSQIAGLVRWLGGDTGDLPIARAATDTLLSIKDIKRMDFESEVRLVNDFWGHSHSYPAKPHELPAGTLGIPFGRSRTLTNMRYEDDIKERSKHPIWESSWMSVWAAVVEGIAMSWNVRLDEVLAVSQFDIGKGTEGSIETGDFRYTEGYDIISRP